MKKLLLFPGAIALILSFSSCKKDYTCECTTVTPGEMTTSATTTIHETKTKAEDKCENMSNTMTIDTIKIITTCKIK